MVFRNEIVEMRNVNILGVLNTEGLLLTIYDFINKLV